MPGSVIALGRIWCSRSMANSTIMAHPKRIRTASSGCQPYAQSSATTSAAVATSTTG